MALINFVGIYPSQPYMQNKEMSEAFACNRSKHPNQNYHPRKSTYKLPLHLKPTK